MAGIGALTRKGMDFLRTRGVRQTARRAVLHFQRKASERRYVRRMTPGPEQLEAQRNRGASPSDPLFSVIVPLYNTPLDLLEQTIGSVRRQSYEKWELCLADGSDGDHGGVGAFCQAQAAQDSRIRYRKLERNEGISGNTNAALAMAAGDYIALFDHDDLLMPHALFEMAEAIRDQGADFLYSDEMIFRSPRILNIVGIRFKQDFMPEDLLTNNYICHLTVFRRDLLEKAGAFRSAYDGSQDHDLILRLTAQARRIVHVPKVLYLWRSIPGSTASDVHTKEYAIDAGRRAVADYLHSHGRPAARVESSPVFPTMYRITEPLEGNPSVGVFLLNREGLPGEEAARRVAALRAETSWKNCAWHPVSAEGGREASLARLREEAARAEEDYLVFLDGIPELRTPDWIQEMLMLASQEAVGAVGAKVRFENGRDLRHAGIILGLGRGGTAGRPYFDRFDDEVGFFGQLAIVRNVTAVTDAWMVSRRKFAEAGGFDPAYAESLFDVDLCLKLRAKGLRNLWTPDACLCMGRAGDFRMEAGGEWPAYPRDSAVFREKWAGEIARGDPCYNPNLSLKYEDWRLA